MISLEINILRSVCLCLAPKFERVKDYKNTDLVKTGRLLNYQPHMGKDGQAERLSISEPANLLVVHCTFTGKLISAPRAYGYIQYVLPLAQTSR